MSEIDPNHLSWLTLAAAVLWKSLPWLGEELRAWRLVVQQLIRAKYGVREEGK